MNLGERSLTVLGSSSSIPRPGRACSSYLIEADGFALALDFGTGSFANLRSAISFERLDAVVVTHMHPDHFLDLIPLRYALRYGRPPSARRLRVFVPPGGAPILRGLAAAFARETTDAYFDAVYKLESYDPARPLALGPFVLHFAPTTHFIPTFAVRCETAGASLGYSADTAPSQTVVRLAREADVFLCEATLGPDAEEPAPRGHLSAREAGELARDARVRRLALTHYPGDVDARALVAAAARSYDGEIIVVDDRARIPF
ncbi:MAG: MBL fold metallo-hydrolase [Candidatus Baltobacteraceae bacterium]